MDKSGTHFTRRGFMAGALAVGIVSASGITAGGTTAWIQDSESSRGNLIETGTLNLDYGSPSSLDLAKDLTPGSSVKSSVELTSPGSRAGSVDVDVAYTDAAGGASADAVARELEVTQLDYGGTSHLTQLSDLNGNGIVDLEDFASSDRATGEAVANDLIDLADPGTGTAFTIELTLQSGTNNLDGNSIDIQFTFHLNQTDGM